MPIPIRLRLRSSIKIKGNIRVNIRPSSSIPRSSRINMPTSNMTMCRNRDMGNNSSLRPFAAQQLEQLVAPIALYPDNLIAQILAAATYPAQISAADQWLRAQGYASAYQVAAGADAQAWDPSVKALTAFPQVLSMLDRDLQWTTDLGNAYYNQPQDVMQTIQVLRQRAQSAGTLQNTPQETVSNDQGYIQLAPANPQVVYVPTYNPWYAYGAPIAPYPGFNLLGAVGYVGAGLVFGAGIALGAFFRFSFGWLGWGLNWHGGGVYYNHAPYYSRSTSVAHWGGGYRGGYGGRGGFNGRPQPEFRQSAGGFHPQGGFNRQGNEYGRGNTYAQGGNRTFAGETNRGFENYNRGGMTQGNAYAGSAARPAMQGGGFNSRPQPQYAAQSGAQAASPYAGARPNAYAGGNGYGNAYSGARPETYARPNTYGGAQSYARPASPYPNPQQSWRSAAPAQQRGFDQRSFGNAQSYSAGNQRAYAAPRGFAEARPQSSGGFRGFGGGGHESFKAPKEPKAPKMSGGGSHGGSSHGGGKHH